MISMKNNNSNFIICVDSREQRPYLFPDHLVQQTALPAGDYSIKGFETQIAIERKQANEIYTNFGVARERFMRECEKLAGYERKAIIIENSLDRLSDPPEYTRAMTKSKLRRSHVIGAIGKIVIEFGIPIIFAGGRREGNELCHQFLKQYYRCKRLGREIAEPYVFQEGTGDG